MYRALDIFSLLFFSTNLSISDPNHPQDIQKIFRKYPNSTNMKAAIYILFVLIPQFNLFKFFPFQDKNLNEWKSKEVFFLADLVDPNLAIKLRQVRF